MKTANSYWLYICIAMHIFTFVSNLNPHPRPNPETVNAGVVPAGRLALDGAARQPWAVCDCQRYGQIAGAFVVCSHLYTHTHVCVCTERIACCTTARYGQIAGTSILICIYTCMYVCALKVRSAAREVWTVSSCQRSGCIAPVYFRIFTCMCTNMWCGTRTNDMWWCIAFVWRMCDAPVIYMYGVAHIWMTCAKDMTRLLFRWVLICIHTFMCVCTLQHWFAAALKCASHCNISCNTLHTATHPLL